MDKHDQKVVHASKASSSTSTDEWETPKALFEACSKVWGPYEVDVAASADNCLGGNFYSISGADALTGNWGSDEGAFKDPNSRAAWMNPPYSRVSDFMEKARYEIFARSELRCVTCLVPARTDTKWFDAAMLNAKDEYKAVKVALTPIYPDLATTLRVTRVVENAEGQHVALSLMLLKGRLKFTLKGVASMGAPFPSCIIHDQK